MKGAGREGPKVSLQLAGLWSRHCMCDDLFINSKQVGRNFVRHTFTLKEDATQAGKSVYRCILLSESVGLDWVT